MPQRETPQPCPHPHPRLILVRIRILCRSLETGVRLDLALGYPLRSLN